MTAEEAVLVASAIGAVSTLVGVGIGAFVSYRTAKLQFLASVISASRQKWSDDMREALARFLVVSNSIALLDPAKGVENRRHWREKLSELSALRYEIRLLLNPEQKEHKDVARAVELVAGIASTPEKIDAGELAPAHSELIRVSQLILKEAWEQAKDPE